MIVEIKRKNAIKNIRWGIFPFKLNGKCFFISRTGMLKNTIFPITSNCLPQIKPNYETLQCTKLFLKNWNATSVGLSQGYSYTDKHIINCIQERTLIS